MPASNLVIVESPAKAKTIGKYLGPEYRVLASYGHVRDLPPKDGSVDPDSDFAMRWQVQANSRKHLDAIADACKGAARLLLATDPDREGEAISWHVLEELSQRHLLKDVQVARVAFHEITRNAVQKAMETPRTLNRELVDAYLARRALDYLVGFTLSPVLWRKLPGAKSAGRVQSVALRLICEREAEIEVFKTREYWSVEALLNAPDGSVFPARLERLNGEKLDRLALGDRETAEAALGEVRNGAPYKVVDVARRMVRRNPWPPFTTSTLQQEASRRLRLGASRTMQIAQKLYEGVDMGGETTGLITYMRTDSVTVSTEAVGATRRLIEGDFGATYLPEKPRLYKTKAKNAQEAHEAIRPTDITRRPESLKGRLDEEALRLYELIWRRMVASQMESARLDQMAVSLKPASGGDKVELRAVGSTIAFDGFLKLYADNRDEDDSSGQDGKEDDNRKLPPLAAGDDAPLQEARAEQHFTQPPPRYSEAGLVKRLEELGIGRPSTYASILKVLQDRAYVRLEKRRFLPEDRGRLVTSFLSAFFERYFDYGFTADLEEKLDDISGGRADWKQVMREFWDPFHSQSEKAISLTGREVRDALDKDLGRHFFSAPDGDEEAARRCPACGEGRLGLNFGRWGAFIACSNYPDCRYTRQPGGGDATGEGEDAAQELDFPKILGTDPETQQDVSLRKGPYGPYVQLGEATGEKGKAAAKPKRSALPKGLRPADVTLDIALGLLALPRTLGKHPDSEEIIQAGIGRYGPYLKHGKRYMSLPEGEDVLSVGINRAVELLSREAATKSGGDGRELGSHPEDGKPILVSKGRYGPYVRHGKLNASLPRDMAMEDITLEQALELLAARAEKVGGGKGRAAKAAKPRTTRKTGKRAT